jgi:hypothetical protein
MKTRRIIQPGQPGTKKLVETYGDNLICVRYRYDDQKKMMYKTIEIIIEEKPGQIDNQKIPKYKIMDIRIGFNEVELRSRIKKCGGKWDASKKVWQLAYDKVKELDLLDRIVDDKAP